MKEIRVCVVDAYKYGITTQMSDDEFMNLAELEGNVYSLQGFTEAFNFGQVDTLTDILRFIEVDNFN